VNELFKGDSSVYNETINELNSCDSREEAFNRVDKLTAEKEWDSENTTVQGFIELVERRYLS
jgi:hypothetical protein